MKTRTRTTAISISILVFLAMSASPCPADREEETPSVRLPLTIEKVWFRTDKNRGMGKSYKMGDLRITGDAVEFVHRKKGWKAAWSDVEVISLGYMRGDVDTEWIVLKLRSAPEGSLIGLRDGRKMGFGGKTREIHAALKEAARISSGAQYAVPPGFRTYDELEHLFTIGIPESWSAFPRDNVIFNGRVREGTVLFYEGAPEDDADGLLREIEAGERASFEVERREPGKGLSCDGLDRSRIDARMADLIGDRVPEVEPAAVGGCSGFMYSFRDGEDRSRVHEIVVVADRHALFLFRLHLHGDRTEEARATFESSLETVRFNVAN